jgi:hypothetical protein
MLENLIELKPQRGRSRTRCRLSLIRETLDYSDRQILDDALADRLTWSTRGLLLALTGRGLDISYSTLYHHRNGTCGCEVSNAG